MSKNFEQFNLESKLLKNIPYQNPTTIQKRVLQEFKTNKDIIAISKSGTGKTASYILPIVDKIIKSKSKHILRALIVVPTKELVEQVSAMLSLYSKNCGIRHNKLQNKKREVDNIDIIISTPNRLSQDILQQKIDVSSVNSLVVDEADMIFGDGFVDDMAVIFDRSSKNKQTLLLGATISQNIKYIAKSFLNNYRTINVSNRLSLIGHINYKAYKVDKRLKSKLLIHILRSEDSQAFVFVNTKEAVQSVVAYINNNNLSAKPLHGDIDFVNRDKTIRQFKQKDIDILVSTNIGSRGVDIVNMPLVINFELPKKIDDFTHRCGRTGRAGHNGKAISLLTTNDYKSFDNITSKLKLSIKREVMVGFELKDYQPKQKSKKKLLTKKKLKKLKAIKAKTSTNQTNKTKRKKITKRG